VVHRDVKPANVLLGVDGGVKLADLGVGLAIDHTRITQSGQVLGTPAYMSPEQVDGATPTAAMDIYALGAVAYEVLSGEKARKGQTPLEVAHRVTTEPPPDLRRVWSDAPPAAAEAIKRAMARDPARRPASAGEFVEGLSYALTRPRAAATPPLERTAAMRPLAVSPRRRLPGWVLLLAVLAVVGAAALAIALSSGGGGSGAGSSGAHQRQHQSRQHKAAATSTPAPSAASPQTGATSAPPGSASESASALNDQGKALIDSGRPAEAIPILQRALAAFPRGQRSSLAYAYTLFNLADAYLRAGQPDKAIPLLRERLKYPDQRDVVQAELQRAEAAAGSGAPSGRASGPGKGKKKGHHKGD
jgi:eukaryotic-like serine/threonine-protein kinase